MLQIGLLGCGNIAGIIASQREGIADIVACLDVDTARARALADRAGAAHCTDVNDLLEADYPVLVEAASIEAVRSYLLPALDQGKDVVVLSVGALADAAFMHAARELATRKGRRIYVPSGAIFGLDNIKVAGICGLDSLLLKTTKHPRALGLPDTDKPHRVFRGTALEAIARFPKNINVSTSLGLATGVEPVVEVWADNKISSNRHEISASGPFGAVIIRCDNKPSPDNPATSYLAALSVLTLLKGLDDPVRIGT